MRSASNAFTMLRTQKKNTIAHVTLKAENKSKAIVKDVSHYLKAEFCKGSKAEIALKPKSIDRIKHPTYIIYDFETDTHTHSHS